MLDVDRLWYYVPSLDGCLHLSYIELNSHTTADFVDKGSQSSLVFAISYNEMGRGPMYLRAKNRVEAESWVNAIGQRHETCSDNDVIFSAEGTIASAQFETSREDIRSLRELAGFEGMLKSRLLCGHFQSFLEENFIPESFKFWQYAEDFRRGHPKSKDPLPFVDKSAGQVNVRSWATSIYDTFLRDGAPVQISDCSGEDNMRVQAFLSAVEIPSNDIFLNIQAICFLKLKHGEGHYPAFIGCKVYRYLLMAALHARIRNGNYQKLFATSFVSDSLSQSEIGVDFFQTQNNSDEVAESLIDKKFGFFQGLTRMLGGKSIATERDDSKSTSKSSHSSSKTNDDDDDSILERKRSQWVSRSTPWRRQGTRESRDGRWLPAWWWELADVRGVLKEPVRISASTWTLKSSLCWMPIEQVVYIFLT